VQQLVGKVIDGNACLTMSQSEEAMVCMYVWETVCERDVNDDDVSWMCRGCVVGCE
jgi:hypothetical protein